MKHLCNLWAAISIIDEAQARLQKQVAENVTGGTITYPLTDALHPNVESLRSSAAGALNNKIYHLCTLLYRNLQSAETIGTHLQDAELPAGPVGLRLDIGSTGAQLTAAVGESRVVIWKCLLRAVSLNSSPPSKPY